MSLNYRTLTTGFNIAPKSSTGSTILGDFEVLTSNSKAHFHNGVSNSPIVTEAHTATLTNKTIVDAILSVNDLSTAFSLTLQSDSNTVLTANRALTFNLVDGDRTLTIPADASVSNTNTGDITLAPVGSSPAAEGASLSGQILTLQPADGTHPGVVSILSQSFAGAKTFLNTLTISATSNQIVLGNTNTITVSSTAPASSLTYTLPDAGSNTEIILGSAQQVITNKDIDGGVASNQNRLTLPQDTKSNLDLLTRKTATIVFANDEDIVYIDNGSALTPLGGNFSTFTTENISSGGTISLSLATGLQYRRIQGNGSAVVASSTPFGAGSPTDGIIVRLVGMDDDNTVQILNNDASKGCLLNGNCTLHKGDIITLQYDAVLDRYMEVSRNF